MSIIMKDNNYRLSVFTFRIGVSRAWCGVIAVVLCIIVIISTKASDARVKHRLVCDRDRRSKCNGGYWGNSRDIARDSAAWLFEFEASLHGWAFIIRSIQTRSCSCTIIASIIWTETTVSVNQKAIKIDSSL